MQGTGELFGAHFGEEICGTLTKISSHVHYFSIKCWTKSPQICPGESNSTCKIVKHPSAKPLISLRVQLLLISSFPVKIPFFFHGAAVIVAVFPKASSEVLLLCVGSSHEIRGLWPIFPH